MWRQTAKLETCLLPRDVGPIFWLLYSKLRLRSISIAAPLKSPGFFTEEHYKGKFKVRLRKLKIGYQLFLLLETTGHSSPLEVSHLACCHCLLPFARSILPLIDRSIPKEPSVSIAPPLSHHDIIKSAEIPLCPQQSQGFLL